MTHWSPSLVTLPPKTADKPEPIRPGLHQAADGAVRLLQNGPMSLAQLRAALAPINKTTVSIGLSVAVADGRIYRPSYGFYALTNRTP